MRGLYAVYTRSIRCYPFSVLLFFAEAPRYSLSSLHILCFEVAGPAMDEGEGLGEGLADDAAGFFGLEALRVNGDNSDCERVDSGREVGIEGFEVVEDRLFGALHLHEVAAGDGDDDD